jgi:hypothetical protein
MVLAWAAAHWWQCLIIWTVVAVVIGLLIGKSIRNADLAEAKRHPRSLVPCVCGCNRLVPVNSPWDGMHGPS